MPKRTLPLLALAVAALLALGACGGGTNNAATTTTKAGGAAEVTLVNPGTLTVCSDIPYKPFEMPTEDDPTKFEGYDVDIITKIAEANGWKTEFIVTPFDGIIGAVNAGTCDVIASAMTITDERKASLDFTNGYFDSEQSLLVKKSDESTFKNLEALAGKTIGVQAGTTGETYANEHKPSGATIQAFPGAPELFAALASDQIQAVLQDFPVNYQQAADDDTVVIVETFPTEEQYGFAVKKGNTALLDALNKGIAKLKSDGDLDKIFKQYFPNAN